MRLEGKVGIVTGASRGIGQAVAIGLAREGASVAFVARTKTGLDETASQVRELGRECLPIVCDVTRSGEVREAVEQVVKSFGRVDILVNNAGGMAGTPARLEEVGEDDWDRVLNVNLKSAFLCTQAVVPHMKRQGKGVIVNIASEAGRNPLTPTRIVLKGGQSSVAYSAANAGEIGLTKHLAYELGPFNIRVNAVAPGRIISSAHSEQSWRELFTDSQREEYVNLVPLRRPGINSDIVGPVLYLLSDDAAYITGAVLDVNGGVYSA